MLGGMALLLAALSAVWMLQWLGGGNRGFKPRRPEGLPSDD